MGAAAQTAIHAAVAAGIRRIVCFSFMTVAPGAIFTVARRYYATKQDIGPGVAFTFLRGSYFFMEVLRLIIGDDGVSRIGTVSSYPCGGSAD